MAAPIEHATGPAELMPHLAITREHIHRLAIALLESGERIADGFLTPSEGRLRLPEVYVVAVAGTDARELRDYVLGTFIPAHGYARLAGADGPASGPTLGGAP